MVCRLGKWCDPTRVYFDEATRFARLNGQWTPIVRSEDWFFTARAAACGAKVMATTTLQTIHHGTLQFPSDQVWGMPQDVEGIAQWQAAGVIALLASFREERDLKTAQNDTRIYRELGIGLVIQW